MIAWSRADSYFMDRALALAKRAQGQTRPNPLVGAIIVDSDGLVLGEGFHQRAGCAHAEVEALDAARAAGRDVRGATMYVTLEPCNHQGRTGPCSHAIVNAGIRKVVCAMHDLSRLAGGGGEYLRSQGLSVQFGCREAAATLLNPGFVTLHRLGRPLVTLKWAMTLDGCTSVPSGDSRWVTAEAARAAVHRERAQADAVLAGVGTVLRDGARLTARVPKPPPGPPLLRVVLDTELRLEPDAPIFQEKTDSKVLLACANDLPERRAARLSGLAELLPLPRAVGGVCISELLSELGRRGVQNLIVEGGRTVAGSFLEERLVDRVQAWIAPKVAGGGQLHLGPIILPTPPGSMGGALEVHHVELATVEQDFLIEGWLSDHLFP